MQIARETSFQLSAERSLTEPYVAHMLSKALTSKSALFIGNSMPIRDVDMYGCSSGNYSHVVDMMLSAELPCQWIQVTGNRGASGIDGLLSSATGFAVGCKKRVRLCPYAFFFDCLTFFVRAIMTIQINVSENIVGKFSLFFLHLSYAKNCSLFLVLLLAMKSLVELVVYM